jgi:hypothetical protein
MKSNQNGLRKKSSQFTHASSPIISMVWTGGNVWPNSKARVVALASSVPSSIAKFKFDGSNLGYPAPTPAICATLQGSVIVSIGGSSATPLAWATMAYDGVNAWVTQFKAMFVATGLRGIDWDLELIIDESKNPPDLNPPAFDFIGQVSQQLKAENYIITFTMFGNVVALPNSTFLNKYADACTYVTLMLYNGGMWVDNNYGSWCGYASDAIQALPAAMQSKLLYAVYPRGGNYSCCAPCIQQIVDFIRAGKGLGVAFWCEGGYTGDCNAGASIVSAWVDILNSNGGSGVADFEVAYSNSTCFDNKTVKAVTSFNGCGYNYKCSNSACVQDKNGTYQTSDCDGACSGVQPTYNCVNGQCTQATTDGKYTESTCGGNCTNVVPPTYNCVEGQCTQDTAGGGTYQTSNCEGKCGGASQTLFSCSGTSCVSNNTTGTYLNSDCDGACQAQPSVSCSTLGYSPGTLPCDQTSAQFTCNGETRCCCYNYVPAPNSINPTACVPSTSTPTQLYTCVSGTCTKSTTGTTYSNCKASCGVQQQLYACVKGKCTQTAQGEQTLADCKASTCEQLYACVNGKCTQTAQGKQALADCKASTCEQLYACVNGKCTQTAQGKQTLADCKASTCEQLYACVNGKCTKTAGGTLTNAACQLQCPVPSTGGGIYSCANRVYGTNTNKRVSTKRISTKKQRYQTAQVNNKGCIVV